MSWKLFWQIVALIIIAGVVLCATKCAGMACRKMCKKAYMCQMMGMKKGPTMEMESQKGICPRK